MKTNEKTLCFRVPQSSSLPRSREELWGRECKRTKGKKAISESIVGQMSTKCKIGITVKLEITDVLARDVTDRWETLSVQGRIVFLRVLFHFISENEISHILIFFSSLKHASLALNDKNQQNTAT